MFRGCSARHKRKRLLDTLLPMQGDGYRWSGRKVDNAVGGQWAFEKLSDIYRLRIEDLINLEGWAKGLSNLIAAISKSKGSTTGSLFICPWDSGGCKLQPGPW